jgi:hypothetical protein
MSWLRRLWPFAGANRTLTPVALRPAQAAPARAAAVDVVQMPDGEPPVSISALAWLTGFGSLPQASATADEQKVLKLIDDILAAPAFPDRLLPRAAHLIPQLIALLRQSDLPAAELTARIGKDALLSAEVMRLADSPYYRGQDPVRNLEQAVLRIGEWGLQQVISRVILKPIYRGTPGPWSARAAARHWEHAETLARHAAAWAPAAGQPVFEAYLAGMLRGTGWIIALNLADGVALPAGEPPTQAFADALEDRVHRLFGHAAQGWNITPGFTAFSRVAYRHGAADLSHGLSAVLQGAHRDCMRELLAH